MIIYKDKNILVINKPANLLVHSTQARISKQITNSKIQKFKTLTEWLIKNYPEIKNVGEDSSRPGIVHRLDKETSGILVIARNQKTFEFLKEQFKNRKVKKVYIALVKGVIKNQRGKITTPIKRFTKIRDAETEYKILEKFPGYTLLEVSPKTGRTHQIRIHLKSIGHPVVCDRLYTKKGLSRLGGARCPFDLKRHFLHAKTIELMLPDGGRIKLEVDLPDDLGLALNSLRECDKK